MVAFVSNNPFGFWLYAERGCQKAAEEENVRLVFRRPSVGNIPQQTAIIEDLMNTGLQGLAISPEDPGNFVGYFRREVTGKIPLIMADNDLPDPKVRNCYIGTHNYRAGRAAGALVKKAIPDGGKIVIFVGKIEPSNAVERRQGLLDYLAGKDQEEMKAVTSPSVTDFPVGKWTLISTVTDGGNEPECLKKTEDVLGAVGSCLPDWPMGIQSSGDSAGGETPLIQAQNCRLRREFSNARWHPDGRNLRHGRAEPLYVRLQIGQTSGPDDQERSRYFQGGEHRCGKSNLHSPPCHRQESGPEKIGNSETVDVNLFYPETKKLRGE